MSLAISGSAGTTDNNAILHIFRSTSITMHRNTTFTCNGGTWLLAGCLKRLVIPFFMSKMEPVGMRVVSNIVVGNATIFPGANANGGRISSVISVDGTRTHSLVRTTRTGPMPTGAGIAIRIGRPRTRISTLSRFFNRSSNRNRR